MSKDVPVKYVVTVYSRVDGFPVVRYPVYNSKELADKVFHVLSVGMPVKYFIVNLFEDNDDLL